jgi:hypothetical protein
VVTDFDGTPATVAHTGLIAGSPDMQKWLLELLKKG